MKTRCAVVLRKTRDWEITQLWREFANSLGIGAPAATRTRDPRLRRPVLYPTELRARGFSV
jgi:hypothetical protein